MDVSGFRINKIIHRGRSSTVYDAFRSSDNQGVMFKTLTGEFSGNSDNHKILKDEYRNLNHIDSPYIIKALGIVENNSVPILIMESIMGETVSSILNRRTLTLSEFLDLALCISNGLNEIHKSNMIHRRLSLETIIWNPETNACKIIDLSAASETASDASWDKNASVQWESESNIGYISPEQTGRLNRVVDYRTDFYSLGIIFYKIITNVMPFVSDDVSEIVHSHLAKTPTLPHEIRRSIPVVLSEIIMKLLSKNPEERYQSTAGLIYDLEKCRANLKDNTIRHFRIATHDMSIPQNSQSRLVGRKCEIVELFEGYNQCLKGRKKIIFLSGHEGIGKTSLVHEIERPVFENNGLMIQGKFDFHTSTTPYHAIANAIDNILTTISEETGKVKEDWISRIRSAVGNNGQIIIDIIPKLETIIGPQKPVPDLPPVESQNRIFHVFQNFIKIFSTQKHPLVFFMDDLHLADRASVDLIFAILSQTDLHHFLFIGTLRSDIQATEQNLDRLFDLMRTNKIDFSIIPIKPLNYSSATQMVGRLWGKKKVEIQNIQELQDRIFALTEGNPSNIHEIVNYLNYQDFLDVKEFPESIDQLYVLRSRELPENSKKILEVISCFGASADIYNVSKVLNQSISVVLDATRELIQAGFIGFEKKNLVFLNNQMHAFIYYRMAENVRLEIHYKIGELYAQNANGNNIYEVIYHLNLATSILGESEKEDLLNFLYIAAKRAKRSAAYYESVNFFRKGSDLLASASGEDRNFKFNYMKEWSESEYLSGNNQNAEDLFRTILDEFDDVLQKKEIYAIMIRFYFSQMKTVEAISMGKKILRELGIKIPRNPTMISVFKEFLLSKILISRKKNFGLINLPEIKNKRIEAAMEIMGLLMPPALISDHKLVPILILRVFNLSLNKGISGISPLILALYGTTLSNQMSDIKNGIEFGQLALDILTRMEEKSVRAATLFTAIICTFHFKWSFQKRQEKIREVIDQCLEDGNFEYFGYCVNDYNWSSFYSGINLNSLISQLVRNQNKLQMLKLPQIENYCNMFHQAIEILSGKSPYRTNLSGDIFNEDQVLPILIEKNDNAGQTWLKVLKMYLNFMLGNSQRALEYGLECEKMINGLFGLPVIQIYLFYYALIICSVMDENGKLDKNMLLKVKKIRKQYKKWGSINPSNYLNKYFLLEAEVARVEAREIEETALYYQEAIKVANEYGLTHEKALAQELAAKYFKHTFLDELSKLYIHYAYEGYLKWGCQPKVDTLLRDYPDLRNINVINNQQVGAGHQNGEAYNEQLSTLDLNSILKTSVAISREINLEELLKKLIKIASENAGAEVGYFLLNKNGEWLIEAAYRADSHEVSVMHSMSTIQDDGIPVLSKGVLNSVIKLKQTIVLDDAVNNETFNDDLYIQMYKTKSILCIPFLVQGRLAGILYLENSLLYGCFTQERIGLLQLLSGHIAVSINNAQLYENLDHKVKERTIELERERNKLQDKNLTMERDIALARKIQFNLIPQKLPVSYAAHLYTPMENLGGDFFDIIQFENSDKVGIFISDVSGHGVTAAFVTSMIKSIIHQSGEKAMNPASLLMHMNEVLENMTSGNFVTAFYGIYDPQKSTMLYSNAGHNLPYLVSSNGIEHIDGGKNTAIAILPNDQLDKFKLKFHNSEISLPIGGKLLIYTDGLTEATPLGKSNTFEGDELDRHILRYKDLPAKEFIFAIYSELVRFRGSESFDDDICFLCLDITDTVSVKRTFKYKTEGYEIRRACLDLEVILNGWGVGTLDIQDMVLAVDEALTNIKEHGYKENTGLVCLEIVKEKEKITITIEDNAKPYEIENAVEIDKLTYVESNKIGGFGIMIIKSLMDSVCLTRENNKNILQMCRNVKMQSNIKNQV